MSEDDLGGFEPAYEGPEELETLTLELESVQHAVELGTTLTGSWFRGHPKAHGRLTPRIFRGEFTDSIVERMKPNRELDAIESFKLDAPAVASLEIPDPDDNLSWLFLMQHYGSPTRLLDWTENPLAALYFAVEKRPREVDGEIWALHPQTLNQMAGVRFGLPYLHSPVLTYLAGEPFHVPEGWQAVAEGLGLAGPCEKPVAFRPTRLFPRMLVQSSVFTIHPMPTPGNTIPELVQSPKGLVRYIVPQGAKHQIRLDLRAIGVTHRTLFPDFEGLSRHIVEEMSVIASGRPDPPAFEKPGPNPLEIAMAAFRLGEELGLRSGQDRQEWSEGLRRTLEEIAEGELTLIGSDLPRILAMPQAQQLSEQSGNEAVAIEREAARLLLRGDLMARRMSEGPE